MRFSPKQRRVLTWWCSPEAGHWEAVICDGAVRSGKTFCLGLSFFCWAMGRFQDRQFALSAEASRACGATSWFRCCPR